MSQLDEDLAYLAGLNSGIYHATDNPRGLNGRGGPAANLTKGLNATSRVANAVAGYASTVAEQAQSVFLGAEDVGNKASQAGIARDEAVAAAARLSLPTVTAADNGKLLSVSPAGVYALATAPSAATTATPGLIKAATPATTAAGTATDAAVTPLSLAGRYSGLATLAAADIDRTNDFIELYDVSTGATKRVHPGDLGGSGGIAGLADRSESFTIASTDQLKLMRFNASLIATLPLAASNAGLQISYYNATNSPCWFTRTGTNTINGATAILIPAKASGTVYSNGTDWTIMGYQGPVVDRYRPYVVLQIQPTGVDNTIIDYSPVSHGFSIVGSPALSVAQVRWPGMKSISMPGAGSYFYLADSPDWYLPGDFTVEVGYYDTSPSGSFVVGQNGVAPNNSWSVWSYLSAYAPTGSVSTNGTAATTLTGSVTGGNLWVDAVLQRSGSTVSLYQQGTLTASTTISGSLFDSTYPVTIGCDSRLGPNPFTGYIGYLRISKGVARYSGATIDVPTSPFPTS